MICLTHHHEMMITISLCTFHFCCSVWFFFLFFFDCATQHVGSWFPHQGLNPHCLHWRRGVNRRLTRGVLIWFLFMSARTFSDSRCFFHQTLSNLSTSCCAPETVYCPVSVWESCCCAVFLLSFLSAYSPPCDPSLLCDFWLWGHILWMLLTALLWGLDLRGLALVSLSCLGSPPA